MYVMIQAATREDLQDPMDHVVHPDTRVRQDLLDVPDIQVTRCLNIPDVFDQSRNQPINQFGIF